jgi:hypothetical protein
MRLLIAVSVLIILGVCQSLLGAQPPATQQMASADGPRVVRGTVEDLRPFKLKEVGEPQMLAKIRTSDGELLVASIGSANALRPGSVERGTQIGMLGVPGSINGKPVFFAQKIQMAPPTTQQGTATTKPSAARPSKGE